MDDSLSALADGCLQGDAFGQAMDRLASDPQALDTWHTYHLIGDVLRSDALAPSAAELAFCERLQARLASEQLPGPALHLPQALPSQDPLREAANATVWRWKWLSGSLFSVLVALVGFQTFTESTPQATLAAVPPVQDDVQVMMRDPQLDALLAAHQQLGGHSALQMPAGFLRNATFERPAK